MIKMKGIRMATKLHQILAVEKGARARGQAALTEAYHQFQKAALFTGIRRNYRPKDEAGDQLPGEATKVQVTVFQVLDRVGQELEDMFSLVYVKDRSNQFARASITVDSLVIEDVPVSYLLWLEKQLRDLATFVSKLPRLDPSEDWHLDENEGLYATPVTETTRTKKIPRGAELAPATDKHAAQVHLYHEDVLVGTWETVKFSGALPATEINQILARIRKLQDAVKVAREEANSTPAIADEGVGQKLLSYVFGS
jgi:hypothetical protein